MNAQQANKIYEVLVNTAGASESLRTGFVEAHTRDKRPCTEWRFMGKLGFGGKYYADRNTVDCYPEDISPERKELIQKIRSELKDIL